MIHKNVLMSWASGLGGNASILNELISEGWVSHFGKEQLPCPYEFKKFLHFPLKHAKWFTFKFAPTSSRSLSLHQSIYFELP